MRTEQPLVWTPEIVAARLAEAAVALAAARAPARTSQHDGTKVAWPDAPNTAAEAYGYTPEDAPRERASGAALDRLDDVLGWIARWLHAGACAAAGLPEDAAALTWKRASGVSWRRIARARVKRYGTPKVKGGNSPIPSGNSRPALARVYNKTLDHVCRSLTLAKAPVVEAEAAPQSDPLRRGDGALPRHMRPEDVLNEQPCGTCAAFRKPGRAASDRGRCAVYRVPVSPEFRASSPVGACCWRAPKPPKAADAERAPG